jgi:hypothetical protein
LEYILQENALIGEKDPDIIQKTTKLKTDLKQIQLQLIDVPLEELQDDAKDADKYFNNPKVNRKYRNKKN